MPIFNNNPDARFFNNNETTRPLHLDYEACPRVVDDVTHDSYADVYTFHAYGTYVNATGTWLRRHPLPESGDILLRMLRDRANTPFTLRGPTPRLSDSFAEATVQPRPTVPMTATAVRMEQERINTAMRAMLESTISANIVSGAVTSTTASTAPVNRTPTSAEILENIQEASRILDAANVPARPPRIRLSQTWLVEASAISADAFDSLRTSITGEYPDVWHSPQVQAMNARSNQGVSLNPAAAWPMPTGEQRGDTITLRDPTPRPIDPAVRAKELGVVEEQTLKALSKLTQLGWRWNGSDWVYKMT